MDKIFIRSHYALHYREATRLRLTIESRPVYTALFLLDGKLTYNIKDYSGELSARGSLLIEPGIAAHAKSPAAKFLTLSLAPTFMLDAALRTRLAGAGGTQIIFRASVLPNDEYLNRLARNLVDELKAEQAGQEVMAAALIEQIVVHLLRHHCNLRRADELELSRVGLVDRRIRRAVELMHANLSRELPLEEIAAAAYLSTFHFARLFKKLTGSSPHAYLAALRTAHAQTLLAETDLSITQLSARVGYSSPSHFAKAFRAATGITPRAFRAALVKNRD